jgi:hypothetical protein
MKTRRYYAAMMIAMMQAIIYGTIIDVQAGAILFGAPETQGGSTVVMGDPPSPPPFPNNDTGTAGTDPNPSGNVIAVSKVFRTLDPINITYVVTNSGGTTEYLFSDTVFNQTGQDWADYHIQLGFTVTVTTRVDGELPVEIFLPSGDPLDLDTPTKDPPPTARRFGMNVFGGLTHESNEISWSMGTLPAGGSANFTFSIDVPDLAEGIPTGFNDLTGYAFTLRQQPTIPEPSTLLLLGSGLLGITAFGRRLFKGVS